MVRAYFRHRAELGMPEYVLGAGVLDAAAANGPADGGSRVAGRAGDSREEKRQALVDLYRATQNCRNCSLGGLRNKFVFGAGNAAAGVMIIGEAPGEDEDRQGKPFVGAAGQLLTRMLAAINLDRANDVFITNVLKCRPPGNRNPDASEALAWSPILARQVDIIAPKAIVILGRVAAREFLGKDESIAKLRGEKLDYRGIPVVVTYHPAALLRNPQYKRPAWDDLRRLQNLLKEL
jgi:uracil-DNA glycosylase family 4